MKVVRKTAVAIAGEPVLVVVFFAELFDRGLDRLLVFGEIEIHINVLGDHCWVVTAGSILLSRYCLVPALIRTQSKRTQSGNTPTSTAVNTMMIVAANRKGIVNF